MSFSGGSAAAEYGTSVFWNTYTPPGTIRPSPAPASALLPSQWLDAIWRRVTSACHEAMWDALPDQIGDTAELHPLTSGDIHFLSERTADQVVLAATAALRALGRLCEDHPAHLNDALPAMVRAMGDPRVAVRYAAVESLWQAHAIDAVPHISSALEGERNETVRETMEHVRRILG